MTVRKTIDVKNPKTGVKTIHLEYETTRFSKDPTLRSRGVENHPAVTYLARYSKGKVYVDERAPEWYQVLAALHEIICCGRQHEDICEMSDDLIKRCANVEEVVLMNAGENAKRYIFERRRMLEFISIYNLTSLEDRPKIDFARKSLVEKSWK